MRIGSSMLLITPRGRKSTKKNSFHAPSITPIPVDLDERIVHRWKRILDSAGSNPRECPGVDSEYVDSCPEVQKLAMMMRCYQRYYAEMKRLSVIRYNTINEGDEEEDEDGWRDWRIQSMNALVNNLPELSLDKLIEIFEHVRTVHFDEQHKELYEYFEEEIGKCSG